MSKVDDMIKSMKEWSETDAGKASMKKFVEELAFKQDLKIRNTERIKTMFTDQKSFNKLVKSIIAKHDDAWINRCHENGVESHPWHLMYALFDLSEIDGKACKPVDGFTDNFPSSIYAYKGWKFAVTYGQGSVCSVYYNKKLMYRD